MYLLSNYLHERSQGIILNGQCSTWKFIFIGFGIGPLAFLIYINDLPDQISSTFKIFTDYTSLFSPVYGKQLSWDELNNDLQKVNE